QAGYRAASVREPVVAGNGDRLAANRKEPVPEISEDDVVRHFPNRQPEREDPGPGAFVDGVVLHVEALGGEFVILLQANAVATAAPDHVALHESDFRGGRRPRCVHFDEIKTMASAVENTVSPRRDDAARPDPGAPAARDVIPLDEGPVAPP